MSAKDADRRSTCSFFSSSAERAFARCVAQADRAVDLGPLGAQPGSGLSWGRAIRQAPGSQRQPPQGRVPRPRPPPDRARARAAPGLTLSARFRPEMAATRGARTSVGRSARLLRATSGFQAISGACLRLPERRLHKVESSRGHASLLDFPSRRNKMCEIGCEVANGPQPQARLVVITTFCLDT